MDGRESRTSNIQHRTLNLELPFGFVGFVFIMCYFEVVDSVWTNGRVAPAGWSVLPPGVCPTSPDRLPAFPIPSLTTVVFDCLWHDAVDEIMHGTLRNRRGARVWQTVPVGIGTREEDLVDSNGLIGIRTCPLQNPFKDPDGL